MISFTSISGDPQDPGYLVCITKVKGGGVQVEVDEEIS